MRRLLPMLTVLTTLVAPLAAQDQARAIVEKVDQLYRSRSSRAVVEMEITTPNWQRTLGITAWSKGTDRTFIIINEPKKERGTATLRIGNEMWNYLPATDKVIKIPPSMMMGSWMGSDFNNDDLVKESSMLEDYTYRIIVPEMPVAGEVYVEMIPKKDAVIVWGMVILVVRDNDYLPLRQEYYVDNGALMREMTFSAIKTMGGKTIPTVMELVPRNKPGNRTVITYKRIEFDLPLRDDIFTQRNLKKGN
ncbi:outer membrane lipoprotein-sorting protein [candidate division TA06 bacterium]|nr:outer membrane lipoprotein-sorting protein [candidate division TA06 bacterium]